jgi:hypothetical protein
VALAEKCAGKGMPDGAMGRLEMILDLVSSIATIEKAIEEAKRPAG